MKYCSILFAIFLCFQSCTHKERRYQELRDKLAADGFNVDAWLLDSLGCYQDYRIQQANILQQNRQLFTNLRLDSVIQILGKPFVEINSSQSITYEYIVEGREFCCHSNEYVKEQLSNYHKRSSIDMIKVTLTFQKKDSTIIDLHKAIP